MDCSSLTSGFEPSSLVSHFHSIPRFPFDRRTPTYFQTNWEYLKQVIFWSALPVVASLVLLISAFIYCCCCCYRGHYKTPRCSKGKCGSGIFLLVILCLSVVGVSFWQEYEWNKNVDEIILSTADDVKRLSTDILVQLQYGVDNSSSLASNLNKLEAAIPKTEGAYTSVLTLINSNQQLGVTFQLFDNSSKSLLETLSPALDIATIIMDYTPWVVFGYLVVLGLVFVCLVMSMCLSKCCSSPCSKATCTIIMLIFLTVFTLTTWAAVGVSLSYLMISSDLCYDPDNLVRNSTLKVANTTISSDVVDYYLVCNNSCVASPFQDYYAKMSAVLSGVPEQEEVVQSYVSANQPSLMPEVQNVEAAFKDSESVLDKLYMLSNNCTRLKHNYLSILHSFCNDGFFYSLILSCMVSGLALLMFIVLICASFFVGLHWSSPNKHMTPHRPATTHYHTFTNPVSTTHVSTRSNHMPTPKSTNVRNAAPADSKKKKIKPPPSPIMELDPPQCDYFNKCERYLQTITNIKSVKNIFDSQYDKCFCDVCAKNRGDARASTAGNPPQKFVVPWGYAKFGVSLPSQAKQLDIFDQWHVCYHGTNANDVCNILQCGRLLKPGDRNPDGSLRVPGPGRFTESTAPDGHNVKQYFFSPTPRYSVLYSTEENFTDANSGDHHKARIVLQVRIKPGVYKVGPSTVAAHLRPPFGPIDHDFTDNELEWMTDHECVHYIYGVLIKLEKKDNSRS